MNCRFLLGLARIAPLMWLVTMLPAVVWGAVVVDPTNTAMVSAKSGVPATSGTPLVIGDWEVKCSQSANSVVTWVCPPFQNGDSKASKIETHIQLIPLDSVGPVSAMVVQKMSHTTGSESAIVSAVVSGTGIVRFRVVVSVMDDVESLVAGNYTTTVRTAVLSR